MTCRHVIAILNLICYLHQNSVFVKGDTKWKVLQSDAMDDLYIQTRQTEKVRAINVDLVVHVCDEIIPTESFRTIIAPSHTPNAFRSVIRSQATHPDNSAHRRSKLTPCEFVEAAPIDAYGYQVCELITEVADFVLALYPCFQLHDLTKVYFLSHGYENDNLFFLFVYNRARKEMALDAYVEISALPLRNHPNVHQDKVESYFLRQRYTYYRNLFKIFPELENRNDLHVDPICTLDEVFKMRLCSLVLDTPYYRGKNYTFPVYGGDVDEECSENLVKMRTTEMAAEYMYGCVAVHRGDASRIVPVYISRGYKHYEVYTFEVVGNSQDGVDIVELDNNFTNIFFITEPFVSKMQEEIRRRQTYAAGNRYVQGPVPPGSHHIVGSQPNAYVPGPVAAPPYSAHTTSSIEKPRIQTQVHNTSRHPLKKKTQNVFAVAQEAPRGGSSGFPPYRPTLAMPKASRDI